MKAKRYYQSPLCVKIHAEVEIPFAASPQRGAGGETPEIDPNDPGIGGEEEEEKGKGFDWEELDVVNLPSRRAKGGFN